MPGKAADPANLHLHVPTITRMYEELLRLYKSNIIIRLGTAILSGMDGMLYDLQVHENSESSRTEVASGWLR